MVIPDDSTSVPGSRQQYGSQGIVDVDHLDSDSVADSEEERTPDRASKPSSRGSSGDNFSSNRHRNEGDRMTAQRPTQEGPPSNVQPPPMSTQGVDVRNVHESLKKNPAPEGSRRTGGYNELPRANTRRAGNEPSTGDKRLYTSSDGRPRDPRDERGPPNARGGGVAEVPRHQGPLEEHRRSPHSREEKGAVEQKEDPEARRGAGGAENRQHGSSATRSNVVAITNPHHPKYEPQRERRPSPSDGMSGGPPKGQGDPAQQRQATLYPQIHPEGYLNPNDGSGNMVPQDRRSLDAAASTQTPPYPPPPPPPPGSDPSATPEGERQQPRYENHQSGSGKTGLLTKTWNHIVGGGAFAPSECRCKEYEQTITTMDARGRAQYQQMQRMSHKLSEQEHKLRAADRDIQHLTEKLQFMTNELNSVHKELVDSKALSDTRGKELIGAQTFLTKADTISVAEVVGLARTVNNEILQVAASLCDSFVPEQWMDTVENSQNVRTHLEEAIGPELTRLMVDNPDKSTINPLVAQMVIQALLCTYLGRGIEKWYDGTSKGHTERIFVTLYDEIRQTENQAVSGRWRALTRARLRPSLDKWFQAFFNELYVMLNLAGWALTDELHQNLPEKLEPVFKAADKVRRAIGEQFTSADIEVAIPLPSTPFNPRELEDEWGDARNPSSVQDIVGGTTGIGLKRRVAHEGSNDIISYETILPPKVVLMSSLREIAEPPPPRQRRSKKVPAGDGAGASGS